METTKCAECKSVMGLIAKTPRWKLYKCFSCGRLMGRIANHLKEHEVEYQQWRWILMPDLSLEMNMGSIARNDPRRA